MNEEALEQKLRHWIGRRTMREDVITERLVDSYRATLDPWLAPTPDGEAPLGIHWCLAPPRARTSDLGLDGHEARGEFLPPVPFARRMWAGGAIEFHRPLPIGAAVQRRSCIGDVVLKRGRSGPLCFVHVLHEYLCAGAVAIIERHDIVYRDEGLGPTSPLPKPDGSASWREQIPLSPALLFRYSALTFNGHRIHYDVDYARDVEGYAGLVVHGPLQATLLMNLAARANGAMPQSFHYRAVKAAIADAALQLCGQDDASGAFGCWATDVDGCPTMTASAIFADAK